MIDVAGDDRATGSNFGPHELGRDDIRNLRTPPITGVLLFQQLGQRLTALVFPDGDILHLRRNDSLAGIVHLGNVAPTACTARQPRCREVLTARGAL